jgi:hypothetical protein
MSDCPWCQDKIEEPYYALSRLDNETKICPSCGVAEALMQFKRMENNE